ncbi:HlyD family efflux transporter periplasmic adaptor subunit [Propionicimonas sp.]|uniref:HlyD family efflux transporter periplasmic adaptor subunit n=1 Tax=Propionicimonas sp. TaxID=1955623 RepID=UPI0039E4A2BC
MSETTQIIEPANEADEVAPPEPPKKRLSRRTRIGLIVIGALALVAVVALVANWLLNASRFVTTDNAQVDGTQITITAPTSGTLTDWTAAMGTQVKAQEPVGRIAVQTGYLQPQTLVRAPADGVVAVNNGVNGAFVAAGTSLAIAYDPSGVFVTARVEETDIGAVKVGQKVDISVDAFPGTPLTGHVAEIKTGAAAVFSLFGQSNTTGNFQKVTQVIAVKVSIDDRQGLALVPGMNVTAKIEK